ncbi:KH domain-containing protein [Tomitella cavernea]|uniref:KH domain-containing protein n=2 Tax=Tomitella cavernea TaxID=1387982 RepID=A0ABP9C403_9ACTN|nr:R3H domain-containing nucleic acid-binding protein [Tomitella cavernea]
MAQDDLLQPEEAQAEDNQSDTPAEDGAAERSTEEQETTDEQDGAGLSGEELLVEEGEIAGDYLEQLLDVLDYDGDIDMDVDGRRAVVSVEGGRDLGRLVGQSGDVLDALQELTRLAVQQQTGVRSRLMLDVAGWRAGKRTELTRLGKSVAERVKDTGEREELKPMTPFERKIVHDAVASVDGVYSESVGTDSSRRVVVLLA